MNNHLHPTFQNIVNSVAVANLSCRLCGEVRPAQEIMNNAGDCDFCNLGNNAELIKHYNEDDPRLSDR